MNIDYMPWRDFFRIRLTGGASPVINPKLFAKEGVQFDRQNYPIWVEEVVGFDSEEALVRMNDPGVQMTITYNVYSDTKQNNSADNAE